MPILGICLGMQLLCECSEEGNQKGLGFVPAKVLHLNDASREKLKIPHMGWNTLDITRCNPLLTDDPEEQRFYFVHSYYVKPNTSELCIAKTLYGSEFCSALNSDNIFGVQFHPEKSHRFGISLMRKFVEL
jgi:glutamine amidotransferase